MKKRIFSLLVAVVMLIGLMPVFNVSVFADVVYTDGVEGWTLTESIKDGTEYSSKLQTVTGMGYNSDKCMYIEFESNASDNGTWGYSNDAVILTNDGYSAYDKTNYTLSMMVKGTVGFGSSTFIMMGSNQASSSSDTDKNKWKLNTVTGLNANATFDDWIEVSVKFTGATENLKIRFQTAVPGLYIDDIKLTADSDTTGTNLLTNGDIEAGAETEEPVEVVYTDGVEGWYTETAGSANVATNKLQTVTGIGRNDSQCMYLEYDSEATDNGTWGFGNDAIILYNNYDAWDETKTYTVSLWIKGDISFSNSSFIWMGDNNASTASDTDKNKFQFNKLHTGNHVNASFGEWTQLTATISGAKKRFALRFQTDVPGLYIDDVSLVANDDTTGTNLLTNGDIEAGAETEEPEPEKPVEVVYTDGVEGWTLTESIKNGTEYSSKLQTVTGMGYNSDKCMYIEFESNASDNGTWGYSNDAVILTNDGYSAYDKTNYTLSMMVKGTVGFGSSTFIMMGSNQASSSSDTDKNKWKLNTVTGKNADATFDDWTEVSVKFTGATENLKIRFQTAVPGLYIDDIKLTADSDTTGTNLLTNGDIESVYQEEWPAVYTDGVDGWKAEASNTTADVLTQKFQTVTGMGHDSYSCMYIEFDSAAENNTTWGFGNDVFLLTNEYEGFNSTKTYTLSMWIKGVVGFSNSVFIQMGDTMSNDASATGMNKWKLSTLTGTQIDATFDDWTYVTMKLENPAKALQIRFQTDVPGLYIDDVSLVADDDTTEANLLTNGTFEQPNEDGFCAYKANIYDAKKNIITKLTEAQSKATITAVATVVNYSCEENYTSQLITCLYDDEVLVKTVMSDITDMPAVGESALLKAEITIPEFTEVGNLKIRTYIWDSVSGMIPLQEEVGEI